MTQDMDENERALVEAFIVPSKRERYRTLLANAKRRSRILNGLNHCEDLDPRYATTLASTADVVGLLRSKGAPERCHLVSDIPALDGREMPLDDAVSETEAGMFGTLIGCIPGKLAYYHDEGGGRRLLLERGS